MKYKLFISDYDGTLGGAPENTIDSQTLSAIEKFEQNGGKFVICTGRMLTSVKRILASVNRKGTVVGFQGAIIQDLDNDITLLDGGLSPQDACLAVAEFLKDGALALAYDGEQLLYQPNEKYKEYIEIYTGTLKAESVPVADLNAEILRRNNKIRKVCALCEKERVQGLVDKYNQKYNDTQMSFNSGASRLIECINKQYNKGQAVRFLAKHFNVSLDEVLCVGDSTNDIPLISGEWHGVAVGDGKDELKAVANEITVPFSQKPVLYLLEKYCL